MEKRRAKNLLLITLDQCRSDWTDNKKRIIELPAIHKLSERGIVFSRCYTSSPQCVPARLSWLTGLKPSQLGVTTNCAATLPKDAPSIIRSLKNKGWHTELIGKTHWTSHLERYDLRVNEVLLKSLGFQQSIEIAGPRAMQKIKCELTDEWEKANVLEKYIEDLRYRYNKGRTKSAWKVRPTVLPNELYPDIWLTNKALEKINQLPSNKPWLIWISYVGPHEPFDTPRPWHGLNKDSVLPKAIKRGEWISNLPDDCKLKEIGKSWDELLDPKSVEELREDYSDHVRLLDDQIARLIRGLQKREDWDNTSMLITSDHGEMLGDHNMLYKSTFLESSIRVPMIFVPANGTNKTRTRIQKPVGLTETMQIFIESIYQQDNEIKLINKCTKKKYITVEYGTELLIVKGNIKACFNQQGKMIWATKTNYRGERKNILHSRNFLSIENIQLLRIREMGRKEMRKRGHKYWLWRDIKNDKS